MAYIANTAFEVRVSNHEFDSAANITGVFNNGSAQPEICSAGFLCKRSAQTQNEGYPARARPRTSCSPPIPIM